MKKKAEMEKNLNSWECDKLFASEASGPQKNLKMGLGGNFTFCGYGCTCMLGDCLCSCVLCVVEG